MLSFSDILNVVLIVKTNKKTKKVAHNFLFSTDETLIFEKIIHYYHLRFQIEFSFRDAKQFFGLEDFMNIKECRVQNFANLSMFMNNVAYLNSKEHNLNTYSVNDLKSMFMSERFLEEVLKIYPKIADEFLIEKAILQISIFSLIHSDSTG